MNSVQENKNELEAAVRYCESAISRANATIESMEFRQQAATKAWHEQTGREESLQREVSELKVQLVEREDKWDDAMSENRELLKKLEVMTAKYDRMKGYADELLHESEGLEERIDEMKDKAFADSNTISHLKERYDNMKDELEKLRLEKEASSAPCGCQAYRDMEEVNAKLRETNNLQKDQIAMFQRKMSRMNEVNR